MAQVRPSDRVVPGHSRATQTAAKYQCRSKVSQVNGTLEKPKSLWFKQSAIEERNACLGLVIKG